MNAVRKGDGGVAGAGQVVGNDGEIAFLECGMTFATNSVMGIGLGDHAIVTPADLGILSK
jgi:hypothetical protein